MIFAGVVAETGTGVDSVTVGDEVIGFTDRRASQAEFVVAPADQLTQKPANVSWDAAGALFVAGILQPKQDKITYDRFRRRPRAIGHFEKNVKCWQYAGHREIAQTANRSLVYRPCVGRKWREKHQREREELQRNHEEPIVPKPIDEYQGRNTHH